jgi:hypothetical protein
MPFSSAAEVLLPRIEATGVADAMIEARSAKGKMNFRLLITFAVDSMSGRL